jgi:hypothetical protein
MTQQIKWCGGSVVLVERYYVGGDQKERYIKAIEPKTTKARLDQIRETYFTKYWRTRKIGTVPVMMKGTQSAPKIMTKKKTVTYNVDELKTLQKNETDISFYKTRLSRKIKPDERRAILVSISVLKKENKTILKGQHKSGKDIAEARNRGRVIVVDSTGKTY